MKIKFLTAWIFLNLFFNNGFAQKQPFEFNLFRHSHPVKYPPMPQPDMYWDTLTASIPFNGECAQGDVAILLGEGNQKLTEPVVIADGFDPGDERPLDGLYAIANQQGLVDSLRKKGMDLVLINFFDGAGYIQRNALLVVKLIDTLQYMMQQVGTYKDSAQIVVIGPSMGGLITRYALTYMEHHGMHHHVRNWISFDSPQKGANIPLGIQLWVKFFAEEADVEDAIDGYNQLNSIAAQQMLIYHFSAYHDELASPSPLFYDFYNELNAMGMPQQTRIVSIINGSGYGVPEPFQGGDQLIWYEYYSFEVDLIGNAYAVPDQTRSLIFHGLYDTTLPFDEVEVYNYVSNTLPYDNAPGGSTTTMADLDSTDTGGYGDIVALHPAHCFIPTISSLCLQNTSDPLFNVAAHRDEVVTPFDTIYYPHQNEDHVDITPQSYHWFFKEVYNFPPHIISQPVTECFEDSAYEYRVVARDTNYWNHLKISVVSMPSWMHYDSLHQVLYGTPTNDNVGDTTVTLVVTDGLKKSQQTFTLTVKNTNDPPFFITDSAIYLQTYADTVFSYLIPDTLAKDIDTQDVLTYFSTGQLPKWITFYPDIHTFIGFPDLKDTGLYRIPIAVRDMADSQDTTSIYLKVLPPTHYNRLNVFPNPVAHRLFIEFPVSGHKEITLYSLKGKILQHVKTDKVLFFINMEKYRKGSYVLHIKYGGKTFKYKIMKI